MKTILTAKKGKNLMEIVWEGRKSKITKYNMESQLSVDTIPFQEVMNHLDDGFSVIVRRFQEEGIEVTTRKEG